MTTEALFTGPDPIPSLPPATAGQRMRERQADLIQAGMHPLQGVATGLRLHPDAPRGVENDGRRTDPYRCGSCAHRRLVGGHAKSFAKCLHGYSKTPMPEAEQQPSRPKFRIEAPRVTNGAATDVAAWWPGCINWTSLDEGNITS